MPCRPTGRLASQSCKLNPVPVPIPVLVLSFPSPFHHSTVGKVTWANHSPSVLYMFGGVLNVLLGSLPIVDCVWPRRNYRSNNTYNYYGYSSTTRYSHNLRRHFWHHPIREWGQKRENKGWFSNTIRVCILIPLVAVIKMLDYVGSHASYASRYCSKLLASRKERFGARLGKENKARAKGRVLPFNIVSRIAQDLHHADLVSVSRASTPLRTLFFGRTDDDVEERLSMLHEASCEGESKSQCGLCDTQICNVSALHHPFPLPPSGTQISDRYIIDVFTIKARKSGISCNKPPEKLPPLLQ
jgi:hypothetical protein